MRLDVDFGHYQKEVAMKPTPVDSDDVHQGLNSMKPRSTEETEVTDIQTLIMDLELDCVDEPLEEDQLIKAKNMRINFENMLKDVAKLKKQTRILTANRAGSQLLGLGTKRPQAPAPVSLVRPVMPSQVSSAQPQPFRYAQQPQMNHTPVTYAPAPRILNRSTDYQVNTTHAQPVQLGNTTLGQMIRTSTATGLPLQPLLYDANSGILLMPTSGPAITNTVSAGGARLAQPNIMPITPNINLQPRGMQATSRLNVPPTVHMASRGPGPGSRFQQNSGVMQGSRHPGSSAIRSSQPSSQYLARPGPTRVNTDPQTQVPQNSRPSRPNVIQQTNSFQGRVGMPIRNSATPTRPGIIQRNLQNNPVRPPVQQQAQEKKKDSSANGPGGDDNSKTFPSLVVSVKPCLSEKPSKTELQQARSDLDHRIKTVLMYAPSKFTEWLMQKGLLRIEHKCTIHQTAEKGPVSYKLGMYSDGGNKQPFSGGYVWISECCPDKQISVFQGSIFEASVYPPGTLYKLIYHWSCQTSATNVLQWVKVTSYYLKNFYTLLRSACVAALHELGPEMGGPKKFVEVGIITLGTSMPNQSAGAKQVKVEILGVFDPTTKAVRLKVVNPQNNPPNANQNQNRVLQVLWPLRHWVHKESTILIDNGIEKSLILEMGFQNVIQTKNGVSPKPGSPTNVNVMNYLKHIVPKMFQNTLCVLSKSLIQQFLDELCWRELWGHTPASTFDNMCSHLIQMTKWETGEPLITRLNKISLNPFGEWSYNRHRVGIDMLPDSITSGIDDFASLNVQHISTQQGTSGPRNTGSNSANAVPFIPNLNGTSQHQYQANKRKLDSTQALKDQHEEFNHMYQTQDKILLVHSYYYAESVPENIVPPSGLFPSNLKCPLCSKTFYTNLEVVRHIFTHVQSMAARNSQRDVCEYCLKDVGALGMSVNSHITEVHKLIGANYPCLICQDRFTSERILVLHMWENHCKQDMPYHCEICAYKSSFHYEVIDHFLREHKGYDSVLCPHCLKVMPAKSANCMKQIVTHLQSHTVKRGKKCPHCVLVFVNDVDYRQHLTEGAHQYLDDDGAGYIVTAYQNEEFNIKMPKPPNRVPAHLPPPPKRTRPDEPSKTLNVYKPALRVADGGATQIEDFRSKYILPSGLPTCIECGEKMNNPNHYPAFISCIKCRFSTSCRVSMDKHLKSVHPPMAGDKDDTDELPTLKPSIKVKSNNELPNLITCSCKFETKNALEMAKHLVVCEKYTAYCDEEFPNEDFIPTKNAAKAEVKTTENFLDQLGLTKNTE